MRLRVVLSCVTWLALLTSGSCAYNERPIIGVLAQRNTDWVGKGDTFIRSSYLRYVEQSGARAVPIRVNESDAYYEKMFESINGLLLPGGGVSAVSSGYAVAAQKLFDMAVKAYDAGDVFPIWGTCLGFQQLAVLAAGEDVLSDVDGWNMSLPLNFVTNYKDTHMYGDLSDEVFRYISETGGTQNMHHYGLLTQTYNNNAKLKQFFNVLTTNTDQQGREYVSSMEGKKYPFYAVQYHPEKNLYEWNLGVNVDHSPYATGFALYLSTFFVELTKYNDHHFSCVEEESKALIDNFSPMYFGEPTFYTIYFFNYDCDMYLMYGYYTDLLMSMCMWMVTLCLLSSAFLMVHQMHLRRRRQHAARTSDVHPLLCDTHDSKACGSILVQALPRHSNSMQYVVPYKI